MVTVHLWQWLEPHAKRRTADANEMVKEKQDSEVVEKAWKANSLPFKESSTTQ